MMQQQEHRYIPLGHPVVKLMEWNGSKLELQCVS